MNVMLKKSAVELLSDYQLLVCFVQALQMKLGAEFLQQLASEIRRRNLY
ncbi:sporulation histidine kinase inhibitor Sda [Paenibacillus sp. GbtcB18]